MGSENGGSPHFLAKGAAPPAKLGPHEESPAGQSIRRRRHRHCPALRRQSGTGVVARVVRARPAAGARAADRRLDLTRRRCFGRAHRRHGQRAVFPQGDAARAGDHRHAAADAAVALRGRHHAPRGEGLRLGLDRARVPGDLGGRRYAARAFHPRRQLGQPGVHPGGRPSRRAARLGVRRGRRAVRPDAGELRAGAGAASWPAHAGRVAGVLGGGGRLRRHRPASDGGASRPRRPASPRSSASSRSTTSCSGPTATARAKSGCNTTRR